MIEASSRQIELANTSTVSSTLVGRDAATLADAVLLKQIGAQLIGNDGAGVVLDPDSLVGQDAASLIGSDAASLLGNDASN